MKTRFYPLTGYDEELIKRIADRHNLKVNGLATKSQIRSERRGNFMFVYLKYGKTLRMGYAKRNPTDKDDEVVAYNIALSRAVTAEPLEL